MIFQSPMRSKFSSHCYKGTSIQAIMAAILLSAGPVSNYRSFIDGGPKHLRKITKETFDEAAQELHKASMGQFIAMLGPSAGLKEVFVKKAPNEECKILLEQTTLCSMVEYMSRYQQPPPRRIARIYLEQLVEMGFLLPEQIRKQPSYSAVNVSWDALQEFIQNQLAEMRFLTADQKVEECWCYNSSLRSQLPGYF